MNIHRLARPKKRKKKELQQKTRGHLAVSHGKHFCKLLIWSGTSGCGATYVFISTTLEQKSIGKENLAKNRG